MIVAVIKRRMWIIFEPEETISNMLGDERVEQYDKDLETTYP